MVLKTGERLALRQAMVLRGRPRGTRKRKEPTKERKVSAPNGGLLLGEREFRLTRRTPRLVGLVGIRV